MSDCISYTLSFLFFFFFCSVRAPPRSTPRYSSAASDVYKRQLNENNPIAVVEAKDNHHAVSHGLQQAMTYAQMLDVPFAYSSNGDGFVEHDFLTGQEREFGLHDFPTEQELIARYKRESSLTPSQEAMLEQPYYASQNTYPPRYYQRCLLYTSPSPRDRQKSRMPSSA